MDRAKLVERLRQGRLIPGADPPMRTAQPDSFEAADLIEADGKRIEVLEKALRPFAKAASIIPATELAETEWDFWVYRPAAGDEFGIGGNDLRRARKALGGTDG